MYDNDKYGLKQTAILFIPTSTNDALEVVARLQFFKNVKVLNARLIPVATAYAATDTFDIYNDDVEIGQVNAGAATGTFADLTDLAALTTATLLNATSSLVVINCTAAGTGSCHLLISYQEMFE